MARKNFAGIEGNPVYTEIQSVTQEQEVQEVNEVQEQRYTQEELKEFRQTFNTQGRKKAQLKRINLAFRDDVYSFISVMARVRGQSITRFVNDILEKSMEENREVYQQAISFRDKL